MPKILLTCEHGGNNIPPAFQPYFEGHEALLASHEGFDLGALSIYKALQEIADVSFYSEESRLLVELNRSRHHPKLFSSITQNLPDEEKKQLLKTVYNPYRDQVEQMVQDLVSAGLSVLHVAVHTFTPVLNGSVRLTDVGLLYDPKRQMEQELCKNWKAALKQENPALTVRYNYPYLGISDGFPTYLRRKFSPAQYAGIELEVNNKFSTGNEEEFQKLKMQLKNSLSKALAPIMADAEREIMKW